MNVCSKAMFLLKDSLVAGVPCFSRREKRPDDPRAVINHLMTEPGGPDLERASLDAGTLAHLFATGNACPPKLNGRCRRGS